MQPSATQALGHAQRAPCTHAHAHAHTREPYRDLPKPTNLGQGGEYYQYPPALGHASRAETCDTLRITDLT
jgi:hypothetical protein